MLTVKQHFINVNILVEIFKNSFSFNLEKKKLYLFYSLILLTAFEQFINANLQWSLNKWKTLDTTKNIMLIIPD